MVAIWGDDTIMDDYVKQNIETYKVMKAFFSPTFSFTRQSIFEKQRLDNFLTKLNPNAYVLDMACGIGKITKYIYEKGFHIDGCDLCEELLSVAKENNPNINFYLSDIRNFETDTKYEAVILSYILFHFKIDDIRLILKKIKNLLTYNGIVHIVVYVGKNFDGFIEDPINDDEAIMDIVKNERHGEKFLTYVHLMEIDEIISVVTKLGYKILDQATLHTDKGIGFSEDILFLDIQKI